jgi:hypothetical protein
MEVEEVDEAAAAAASTWPGSFRRRNLLQFLLHASKVRTVPRPPFPSSTTRLPKI